MTLNEFADQHGAFLRDKLNEMRYCKKLSSHIKDVTEFEKNLDLMYSGYNIFWGYLMAACDYGHISKKEYMTLKEELQTIIGL